MSKWLDDISDLQSFILKKLLFLIPLSLLFFSVLSSVNVQAVSFRENRPEKTKVVIHKREVDSNQEPESHDGTLLPDPPGKPLAGVVFAYWKLPNKPNKVETKELEKIKTYKEALNYFKSNEVGVTKKTNNEGITDLILTKGSYFLVEKELDAVGDSQNQGVTGFIAAPIILTVPIVHPDQKHWFSEQEPLHIYPKNLVNGVTLNLKKINADGEPISAFFKLERLNTKGIWKRVKVDKKPIFSLGNIEITNLSIGEYRLIETKTSEGYILDERPIYFMITPNNQIEFQTEKNIKTPLKTVTYSQNKDEVTAIIENIPLTYVYKTNVKPAQTVGDDHKWLIQPGIPRKLEDYIRFTIIDKLDKRLKYAGDEVVYLNKEKLIEGTDYIFVNDERTAEVNGFGSDLYFAFTPTGIEKLKKYPTIGDDTPKLEIYFSTQIDGEVKDADLGTNIPNEAKIIYDSGTGDRSESIQIDNPNTPIYPQVINPTAPDLPPYSKGTIFRMGDSVTKSRNNEQVNARVKTNKKRTTFLQDKIADELIENSESELENENSDKVEEEDEEDEEVRDPYAATSEPITLKEIPYVWTAGVKFIKLDGATKKPLSGAEFKLSKSKNKTDYVSWNAALIVANQKQIDQGKFKEAKIGEEIVMISGKDGTFELRGIASKEGESDEYYYLTEMKAPKSDTNIPYNKLSEPAKVMINRTSYREAKMQVEIFNNKGDFVANKENPKSKIGGFLPQTNEGRTILAVIFGLSLITIYFVIIYKKGEKFNI